MIDALPVERIRHIGSGQFERIGVTISDANLTETTIPLDSQLHHQACQLYSEYGPWPIGYCTEIRPQVGAWLRAVLKILHKGFFYCIDYGYEGKHYYAPTRTDGTIRTFCKHRVYADPFLYPSLVDITADVDWTEVVRQVQSCLPTAEINLETQASFLLNSDLQDLNQLIEDPEKLAHGLKQIMHPNLMGERFSVLSVSTN